MKKSPTSVYKFPDANSSAIYKYLDNIWQSGVPAKHEGIVVDAYFIFENNCTTVTCEALKAGGVDISIIQTPKDFNDYMRSQGGPTTSRYLRFGPY